MPKRMAVRWVRASFSSNKIPNGSIFTVLVKTMPNRGRLHYRRKYHQIKYDGIRCFSSIARKLLCRTDHNCWMAWCVIASILMFFFFSFFDTQQALFSFSYQLMMTKLYSDVLIYVILCMKYELWDSYVYLVYRATTSIMTREYIVHRTWW